jgi:hypothetical protein
MRNKRRLIARIQAAGIPIVAEAETDRLPELFVRQDVEAYDSSVFDVNGGTGLILPLKVVPGMPFFSASGLDIRLSRWPNCMFRALEESVTEEGLGYQFHGRSDLQFARSQAINGYFAEHKEIQSGRAIRGLLLAFSHEPMPDNLARGDILSGSIVIYDQWEREHWAKIALRVERETASARKRGPNPKRKSLFEVEDGGQ